jgi:guanylate kinase
LRDRLTSRGQDNVDVIEHRMQLARNEISHYGEADYLVINDQFDAALDDLRAIVRAARLEREQQLRNNDALLQELLS